MKDNSAVITSEESAPTGRDGSAGFAGTCSVYWSAGAAFPLHEVRICLWSEPAFKWTKNILKQSDSKALFLSRVSRVQLSTWMKKKCEACRASSKCNDFLSDFFLSYSSICRHLKLHRSKCGIKIVGKDFKCSMKYSSDGLVTLFQHQSISARTAFEQFVNEGRNGFKSFSLHIFKDHQGAVMRDT